MKSELQPLLMPVRVLLAVALLLLAGGPAQAQTDAGTGPAPDAPSYEMRMWTVDGGGVSYTIGGGYTLGGTAGQPDAAAPRTDGVKWGLRAGFWQPSCIASVVPVTISREGDDVVLAWTHDPAGDNQLYAIHRSTNPYFTPSPLTRQGTVTATPWEFTDAGVLGDVGANYTYIVRPACGASWVDTPRLGEFGFTLTPGS